MKQKLTWWQIAKQGLTYLFMFALSSFPSEVVAETFRLREATIAEINEAFDKNALTSEQLVQLYLNRIEAYDDQGPKINGLISINNNALKEARALDQERQQKGPRSPLHGIPIILKDNYDTTDLPTTGGSVLLEGSLPPDDAFTVKKLREAGAIILGKANMSEFAESYGRLGYSSLGGLTRNPYKLTRDPSGSSGGSGAVIAANFAVLATGSDTSGSIRGPAAVAGLVGIKPTQGLVSRDGIIPLTLSFDSAGPIARTVTDAAIALGVMAGVDPNDYRTLDSEGKTYKDYTQFLNKQALKGARIGVAIDFRGGNPEVDAATDAAVAKLRELGATVESVDFSPKLENLWPFMAPVTEAEFEPQIDSYLKNLQLPFPDTLREMYSMSLSNPLVNSEQALNPGRVGGFEESLKHPELADTEYLYILHFEFPRVRQEILSIMSAQNLDAIIWPTMTCPAGPLYNVEDPTYQCASSDPYIPGYLANVSGFPGISVAMGFTQQGLPLGLTFFGKPYSEPTLLGFAYAYEQATQFRRPPTTTPALPGENFEY
ncbi:MAG: amidase [Moorea sp. SIO3I7]|uniref:amidase family protein n=1 Tax=Moorena sp. SIO3I8 TaxID=2607833 RepID=UPI0013C29B2C|nr:amidase family protein [Moorena sp. SIO3I8]NEN99863.1 amidase [Moorena sp. SIO3I7]NEO08270.1 amidase [Moorena sp. SIO3I8]